MADYKDLYLDRLKDIQSEIIGVDMRLSALEEGYALDAEQVDSFIKEVRAAKPATYVDFLSESTLLEIERDYTRALNQGVDCEAWDYGLAAISGVISGLIDALFVSSPGKGVISEKTDDLFDEVVKRYARKLGWKPHAGNEESVASALRWFESTHQVGYDQATSSSVGNAVENMSLSNHHGKSVAHYPDFIGLIASICNQFTGTSTFLDNKKGRIVIVPATDQGVELQGSTFQSKVFAGTVNWFGHCMSDMVGSSKTRGQGEGHRGAGLPIPLTEFFQLCSFGKSSGENDEPPTFATVMIQTYEDGYDFRHGTAMSVPVMINELLTRMLFVLKQHFIDEISWKDVMPVGDNPVLQRMLTVSVGCFCMVDLSHATVTAWGKWVLFFSKLNLVAWSRFGIQGVQELKRITHQETMNMETIQQEISMEWTQLLEKSKALID